MNCQTALCCLKFHALYPSYYHGVIFSPIYAEQLAPFPMQLIETNNTSSCDHETVSPFSTAVGQVLST